MKKSKGIINFPSAVIIFATLCALMVCLIAPNIPIIIKAKAETVTRRYMFKIEEDGYLTIENRNEMINKLESKGCKNVSITGTDSKVNYGQDIYINVEYDSVIKEITFGEGFLPKLVDVTKRVVIPKETVSKCTS